MATALGTMPRTSPGDVNLGDSGDDRGASAAEGGPYSVGEIVDYYSASQGGWIPAKVLGMNASGNLYTLDCKPDVPPEKIRRRRAGAGGSGGVTGLAFSVGEVVEYESASQGRWIPARVLATTPRGTYDLDCKPDVPAQKVRRPGAGGGAASASTASPPTTLGLLGLAPARAKTPPQAELDAPVQLLRVTRSGGQWRYEVCPEGVEALERYGSRRIAVASVCGLYRTGKSFLLNLLLERVQRGLPLFKVGGSTRACTEGLWLYGSLGGAADDDRAPLLAFLDCEGFGSTESDRQRDAQLMTLCALLSSVLVLNTKGALNEGLFNSLALTCRFAEHIEERGHEASRPALLWVLRDFMLELQDAGGRSLTPDEYLEQALQSAPLSAHDEDRARSAKEVRQSLLKFFSHRSCATLVQPASEESDLRDLESVPYSSLRSEFRAGVEALRGRLISACHASPKTVGGEPIGCRSFAALLRQLVDALNASKSLSVRGAWEAVQHGSCGQLADELRTHGTTALRALAAGQRIDDTSSGGAVLPMPDEALRNLFRQQRHALKSQWEDRAVGEESVRREYWQELKESLAREEIAVRQQNTRVADQKMQEALKKWQEWLDDDSPTNSEGDGAYAATGERLSADFGRLMDQLPVAPLSRAGRTAVESAVRRVTAARVAISATEEHYSEAKRKAMEWGAQASQQEGAARSELAAKADELQEAQERLKRLEQDSGAAQMELQAKAAELQDAKAQLEASLQDIEDARQREHELRAQQRITNEKEVSLTTALEEARAAASRAEGDRIAAENAARAASEGISADQERLEKDVKAAKVEAERLSEQLERERAQLASHHEKHREEHAKRVQDAHSKVEAERSAILDQHERARLEHERMVEEARVRLDEDRKKHGESIEGEQQRLLERQRRAGLLEGQVDALGSEASSLRERISQLQATLREADCKAGQQKVEGERLRSEIARAREDAERAKREGEAKIRAREEQDKENMRVQEEERKKATSKSFGFSPFRSRKNKLLASPNA